MTLGFIRTLFDTTGYPARWFCGDAWAKEPIWGWIHIYSDVAISVAYIAMPLIIFLFLRKRKDVPFPVVFWLFILFIISCGIVHLAEAIIFYWPIYRISAVIKLITAIVSWLTVVALIYILPLALRLRSPAELEKEVDRRINELAAVNESLTEARKNYQQTSDFLAHSEKRLQIALEAGGMGTWDWNLKTDMVTLNATESELTGFGETDCEIHITQFMDKIYPHDRERVKMAIDQCLIKGMHYDEEFRFLGNDGVYRWLAGRGDISAADETGPTRMSGVNYSVTQKRATQRQLRLLSRAIDQTDNGIIIADAQLPDFPIVFVNKGFTKLTGYESQETLNKNCRFLQGELTDKLVVDEIRHSLEKRKPVNVTIMNYRKEGSYFWNDLHITPVEDESGIVTHFIGIQQDVSRQMADQAELAAAIQEAEQASHAKSEFLAKVSHEIRTPMTAIMGCADWLDRQDMAEDQMQSVRLIRHQGELLLGILNDILDVSKIEAGKLDIRMTQCDIVQIVSDVVSLMNPSCIDKGIELDAEFQGEIPVSIQTDSIRLKQVLMNLVGNAVKFTDEGQISVVCRSVVVDETLRLIIEVRDTGCGISQEKLKTIFLPFNQADDNHIRQSKGTGLGLTISHRLSEMLNGMLDVMSTPGKGSTFRLTLNLGNADNYEMHEVDFLESVRHSRESLPNVFPLKGRVLVAEDTKTLQVVIKTLLSQFVTEIDVVDNGQLAVDLIKQRGAEHYDFVLMDMQMPVMTGFEATTAIREMGYDIPVIALTAAAMTGDKERCIKAGCNDYLSKPVDRNELMQFVLTHCTDRNA